VYRECRVDPRDQPAQDGASGKKKNLLLVAKVVGEGSLVKPPSRAMARRLVPSMPCVAIARSVASATSVRLASIRSALRGRPNFLCLGGCEALADSLPCISSNFAWFDISISGVMITLNMSRIGRSNDVK